MIRKIKTRRNKNKKPRGISWGGITRPPSQFESNSLFADPNFHRPGERLFGPQTSLRITSVLQCDSNPRLLATSAVSVARHVYRSATMTSLRNISINSRGEQFLKFGGPTESACMSGQLKMGWIQANCQLERSAESLASCQTVKRIEIDCFTAAVSLFEIFQTMHPTCDGRYRSSKQF